MTDEPLLDGPTLEQMIQLITDGFSDAVIARIDSAAFFSLDETHWPNFATLVWTDEHDEYAAFDRFVPHPVYAKQRWISILNPSHATVRARLMPLIAAGHHRLAARKASR